RKISRMSVREAQTVQDLLVRQLRGRYRPRRGAAVDADAHDELRRRAVRIIGRNSAVADRDTPIEGQLCRRDGRKDRDGGLPIVYAADAYAIFERRPPG